MTQDGIGQRLRDAAAHAVETRDLQPREIVLRGIVRRTEVREDARHTHRPPVTGERIEQRRQLLLHEAQTVHSRIELDVDRITLFAVTFDRRSELMERPQAVNLRFEPVGRHRVETVGIGVEYHDGHRDAPLAQQHTLVGERHGQIVDTLMLQQLRNLEIAGSVARGLDHRHEPHARPQLRPEIVQVVGHGIQIDFEHRRVALARERMFQLLEPAVAVAFEQHGASRDVGAVDAPQIVVGRGIEGLVADETLRLRLQLRADADESPHARRRDHRRHARIEFVVVHTALQDVGQDQRRGPSRRHAVQIVQRDGQ